MPGVPTVEELGLTDGKWDGLDDRMMSGIGGSKPESEREEFATKQSTSFGGFNMLMFLVFSFTTLFFGLIYGVEYMLTPYYFVMVWVHEAGHGFWCLLGSRPFCAFSGFFNEMLFTLVFALIMSKEKKLMYSSVCILVFFGFSMAFNGDYMQSSLNPSGTSFAGALTGRHNDVSPSNHDWHIVFDSLGVLPYSAWIADFVGETGWALAFTCLIASIIFLPVAAFDYEPDNIMNMIGPAGLVAAPILFLAKGSILGPVICILFSLGFIKKLVYKKKARK